MFPLSSLTPRLSPHVFGALLPLTVAACSLPTEGTAPPGIGFDDNPNLTVERDGGRTAWPPGVADAGNQGSAEPPVGSELDAAVTRDAQTDPIQRPGEPGAGSYRDGGDGLPPVAQIDASTAPERQCPNAGLFALRAEMEVEWPSTHLEVPDAEGTPLGEFLKTVTVMQAGTGKVSIVVLLQLERDERGQLRALVRPCAAEVPPFKVNELLGEHYGVSFAEGLWESGRMPRWELELVDSCTEPGCRLLAKPFDGLLGIDLPRPDGDWLEQSSQATYPDHDDDGERGITLTTLGPSRTDSDGTAFSHPPVELSLLPARARRIMAGIRVHTQLDAHFEGCDRMVGQSVGSALSAKAISCTTRYTASDNDRTSGPEDRCNDQQVEFADRNLPDWNVISTSWIGVPVRPDASCGDARRAFD